VSALAPTLQAFFTDRLIRQRHASGHTIAAYRDTLRLLLGYAATRTGLPPSRLDLVDLDAPLIASSSITSSTSAATASAPATHGWPQSTPYSGSPHWPTPNMPRASPESWRSHPNASTGR
jgi:hypothetical protein